MRKHILCLFAVLLMVFPLCICCGETADIQQADVNVTLVSYDVLNRYENMYSSDMGIWLRYGVEYDEERFSIEDMEMLYNGPHENMVDWINPLSPSDPDIYDCRFGCMWLKKGADDNYIREMIRDGHMAARILLRDRVSGTELTVECDVDSENAVMGTELDKNAYEITVSGFEYEEIDASDRNLSTRQRMYRDTHPGIKCYRVKLYGKESRKPPYKVTGSVEFNSLSPYLYLDWHGGVHGESYTEWLYAYDLLAETERDIKFEGILLAEDAESIPELIRNADMVVTYSTEYAGTFDTFDAGDRFDGPRLCDPVMIDLDKCF